MTIRSAWSAGLLAAICLVSGQALGQLGRPGLMPVQPGRPLNDPLRSEAMRSDAWLYDVCFVSARYGWAVGDRGTIWHTEDGGRTWQLQASGVGCRLESVCFIDPKRGWAAGGRSHPYTHTSSGVVLRTEDGGRTWTHDPRLMLPALKRIRLVDDRHGWAAGDSSAMFPSGVFVTDSGGRSWQPLPGGKTAGWTAADMLDPLNGAIAGRAGAVATVRRGGIEPARMPGLGLRGLARIELVAPVHGWLIGEGGLLMRTDDLGATWQTPPGPLPDGIGPQFDFTALAVRGPKVWAAGSPGTRIVYTADAGQSWTAFATSQQLPISGLSFVDDQHGWAVGAMGTILATEDGGRTWHRQRSGGTRAALLAVFSQPDDVPLELLARLSGNEGYLGIVEVLGRRDVESPAVGGAHADDRLREAAVGVGACGAETAWQFPLRPAGLGLSARQIVETWNEANDGHGLDHFEARLVRQIRLWRPEIIVTHDASPRGDEPLGHLVDQAVLQAVERAADATSYVDQLTYAGLGPWPVKKVYASLGPQPGGEVELTTAQLAPRLGRSLAGAATEPRGLLARHFTESPKTLGFRLLVDRLQQDQGRQDFFSGIVLQPGGEARRLLGEPPPEALDGLQWTAQKRRNMEAILDRSDRDPHGGAALVAQSAEITRGLDPASAGELLYHLGQKYYANGQWPLAAETFGLLAERYPDHAMAAPAQLWLVQYYASAEAAWRVHGRERRTTVQVSAPAIDPGQLEQRPERAAAVAKALRETNPGLFSEPALRFPLCVADRARGYPRDADRYFMAERRSPTHDAWWSCAQAEHWLAEPQGQPPKPLAFCASTSVKPRLDGQLDDPLWREAKPIPLRSARGDDRAWPAEVMLGYDTEFLYVAVRCRRALGVKYEAAPGPRPRDPDLSAQDRVDVLLDLDRDWATYYRLSIDHRGWTGEGCWGDRSWNPTWFVAPGGDRENWTAEAAIPLEQLTGHFPSAQSAWAVGIQRTVPGVGFQSFSTPAAPEVVPQGFGLLIFR